jgi:ABC-type transport system involved in cytochrome c biogenesis permease subunit
MVILHTACSLLSYVAFLIAFVGGLLFLVQERQLKRRPVGRPFHRIPSLEALDDVNFAAIGVGFWLLTIGLVCGVVGSKQVLGRWWMGDPKEYLTVLLWCSYLALWLMRLRATLRGRRVALLSVLGFSLVLFSALVVSRILPSLHPYL